MFEMLSIGLVFLLWVGLLIAFGGTRQRLIEKSFFKLTPRSGSTESEVFKPSQAILVGVSALAAGITVYIGGGMLVVAIVGISSTATGSSVTVDPFLYLVAGVSIYVTWDVATEFTP